MHGKIELSIVIPTLAEEENLHRVLETLARQDEVAFEVIVADGGTDAATGRIIASSGLPVSLLRVRPGRADQLNLGAAAARGAFILFLHADSGFVDRLALRKALDALKLAAADSNGRLHAGHFALSFRQDQGNTRSDYRYLEKKARLDRKGCSHGDQGMLLPVELFRRYGEFDTGCQVLAETRLADRLREDGRWLLLPAEITTSARRFEREGLKERQILNAVIMALGAVGRDDMIVLPGIYRVQNSCERLRLQPFFRGIAGKIAALEGNERQELWENIGGYICENAWQLAFRADVLINRYRTGSGTQERYRFLQMYDHNLKKWADRKGAARLAAFASRLWLKYMQMG